MLEFWWIVFFFTCSLIKLTYNVIYYFIGNDIRLRIVYLSLPRDLYGIRGKDIEYELFSKTCIYASYLKCRLFDEQFANHFVVSVYLRKDLDSNSQAHLVTDKDWFRNGVRTDSTIDWFILTTAWPDNRRGSPWTDYEARHGIKVAITHRALLTLDHDPCGQ